MRFLDIPDWDEERAVNAIANGMRLVFGGTAGGVGYSIVSTGGIGLVEFALFIFLVGLTGILEYQLMYARESIGGD